MATEESISRDNRLKSQDDEQISRQPLGPDYLPEGYEGLIRQLGNAVERIGQLEAQLDRMVSQGSDEGTDIPEAHLTDEPLTEDINLDDDYDSNQQDDELAQLRLQLSSLSSQLANTEEELNKSRGVKVRRRSKRVQRSKLKFWRSWMRQLSQFNL